MTGFIAIAALFVAVAIGLVAWPLLRRAEGPRAAVSAATFAAVLPLAAFLVYFSLSDWDWRGSTGTPAAGEHDMRRIVTQLQEKLARQPDDAQGWKLLGRSATVIGDYALARQAFGEAYTRTQGTDADAVVGYAESMILLDERDIDGQAAALFERALQLQPDNARALWYGGIVAYRRGDLSLAQQRWVELQDHELPPDLRQVLAERLAELERSQGKPEDRPDAAEDAAIDITVGIDPALTARLRDDATLFVIARRGSGGPPLAVHRKPLGSWPVSLRLSDKDAMLPGMSLAGAGPLTLIARISLTGQPVASSGDLFGEVSYDFASAHPVDITINRVVP
ncbi:MAG TPA: tetratricopeptide repeat protein [Steroidobacteraceae bacterium]|nr:tetratricopeptide repeat protein [Steroidobacteraceae bacterium]